MARVLKRLVALSVRFVILRWWVAATPGDVRVLLRPPLGMRVPTQWGSAERAARGRRSRASSPASPVERGDDLGFLGAPLRCDVGDTGPRVDRLGCEPPPGLGRPEVVERMREATVVVVKQGACSQSWQNDRLLRDELEYIDCQRREANGRALLKGGVTPGLVGVPDVRWNGLSPLCPMPTPPGALRLEAERLGLEGRRLISEGGAGGLSREQGPRTPVGRASCGGHVGLVWERAGIAPAAGGPRAGAP